jgi:chemosensory pili system protein ChpA (sensor histidine kinase/response regulator)
MECAMNMMREAIDTTTLGWIKPELDETLRHARQDIEAFAENPADVSAMRSCAAHLHQVGGTLRMVELHAPAMVADEMEQLAVALQHGRVEERDEACGVLMRGVVQLPDYIERLQGGHRDIPIVLLPLLNELRGARGEGALHESALFVTDLERRVPTAAAAPASDVAVARDTVARALASWGDSVDANPLVNALEALFAHAASEPMRRAVWVALSVAGALRDGALAPTPALRTAFERIEADLARLGDASARGDAGAEGTRQLLFHVAQTGAAHPALDQLRSVFQLSVQAPSESELAHARSSLSGRNRALLDTVSAAIKEDLMRVKDALDLHLRTGQSDVSGLTPQVDALTRVGETLGMMGVDTARSVVMQQRDAMQQIVSGQRAADESALLDIAGALLYVDASLDDQVARLGLPEDRSDDRFTGESRKVLDLVVREAIANFGDARQAFVAFVETGWDHAQLAEVPRLLDEVTGALRILDMQTAAAYLTAIRRYTETELVARQRVPSSRQLDTLADALASIEYYLEALRDHRANRDDILEIARQSLESLRYWPLPDAASQVVETEEADAADALPTVGAEQAVTVDAVDIAPIEVATAEAVMGEAAAVEVAPSASIAEALAPDETSAAPAFAPINAGFEASADIDDDIREVFLEELDEEMANLAGMLPAWGAKPDDAELLRPVRRVFHTLKGSGRLVGAKTLGEFSWKIESLLNRVLDGTRPASPAVVAMVEQAHAILPQFHAALAGTGGLTVDLRALEAVAARLADGEDVFFDAAAVAASAAVEPAQASVAAPVDAAPTPAVVEPEPEAGVPAAVDPVLLEILTVEVNGHLATIDGWLASGLPADDRLQRAIHTLNGAFAMTEVPVITDVTGPSEAYIKRLLAAGGIADAEGRATLTAVADAIRRTLAALESPRPHVPLFTGLAARVLALRDSLPDARMPMPVDDQPTAPAFHPDVEAARLEAERLAAEQAEIERLAAEQAEAERREAERAEAERIAAEQAEAERLAAEQAEVARLEAERVEAERIAAEQAEAERLEAERIEAERIAAEQAEAARLEAERIEADRVAAELAEAERLAAEQAAAARLEAERIEGERLAAEQAELERLAAEAARAEAERIAAQQTEEERLEAQRLAAEEAEAQRLAAEQAEAERFEAERLAAELAELDRLAAEQAEAERLEAERIAAEQAEAERLEAERLAAEHAELERLAAEQAEAEFLEAERAAAEQAELERVAAEQAEAERIAAEQAEAARVEAERLAAEHAEAERLEAERIAAERFAAEQAAAAIAAAALVDADEIDADAIDTLEMAAYAPIVDPDEALDLTGLDPELVDIFVEEGGDLLDHSDGLLAQLRAAPSEREPLVGLQRDLHTLKGGARMAGIMAIGELGHVMESLLEAVVANRVELGRDGVPLLERGFDRLHAMVIRVGDRRAVAMPDELIAEFDARSRGQTIARSSAASAPTAPAVELKPLSAPLSDTPLDDDDEIGVRAPQEQVRIRADLLDRLVTYAGEVAIYRARLEQQLGAFRGAIGEMEATNTRIRDQLRRLEIETEAQILSRYQREGDRADATFDPLELDRFSTLQQLTRALAESAADQVSLQTTLDDLTRQYETLLLQQSRVSSDLQEGLMRTRMVPFDGLLPRLRRVVRQASAELGKQVVLKLDGAQGELDRNVLERMTAPLEHMLRNSVAHGIEVPAKREKAGKPAEGAISIAIRREGSEVVLEVGDDGAGLDREAIRRRALERGLLRQDAVLADSDLDTLILEPGFSTADEVSRLAGRGVGMDVVASEVRQLGGTLDIASSPGKGVRFTLRLPQTLAVTQAVFVKAGETTFAVPIASVRGVGRIAREELAKAHAEGRDAVYRYGDEDYAVHDLGLLIGQAPSKAEGHLQMPLLLIRAGELRAAVSVDQVVGNREIVVKPVGPQVASIPGIFGATIMGDGGVVVILDVAPLVRRQAALPRDHFASLAAPVVETRHVPLVMVVDDSVTMRKVTGRVLERNGFEVVTAKDGLDALERMAETVPDLVLLDVEMPRMDGYELATAMKGEQRLRNVPIMMITSRTGEKHRQRALDIGVNRYLGKPYQEPELMRNVNELLGLATVDA